MTPKEKADELFNKMLDKAHEVDCLGGEYMVAKRCALIAVGELCILAAFFDKKIVDYLEEVKQEIEKL